MGIALDEARETDRLIKRHINTTRYLLLDMRDRKGWKALGYESFKDYGEKELGYQENYIHKLVNAAEISLQIGYSPDCTIVQPPESQLRPLKSVPEAERKSIWDEATRKAESVYERFGGKNVIITNLKRRAHAGGDSPRRIIIIRTPSKSRPRGRGLTSFSTTAKCGSRVAPTRAGTHHLATGNC